MLSRSSSRERTGPMVDRSDPTGVPRSPPLWPPCRKERTTSLLDGSTRGGSRVTLVSSYRTILEDLERCDDEAHPWMRYITLVHRYNELACSEADLEADRTAVREMTALLLQEQSTRLNLIDPEQLVFRLDLDDFHRAAAAHWRQVVSMYRYGLTGGDEPQKTLGQQAEQLTDDPILVVRAPYRDIGVDLCSMPHRKR
jgi:hypothetical protein